MAVRSNIAFIFKNLKLNLQKQAQYKTAFVMQIVMMILNNLTFIIQWIIVFSITKSIGGYGFREVILLWAISAGAYGVAHLFFEGAFHIDEVIYEGKLDVYLTQPKNVLISLCSSESRASAIGDILYVFIALLIIKATWWWFLAIIPVCLVGGILYTAIVVCFQNIAFYVKRGGAVANVVDSAITMFSNYPPVIFNFVAKLILFTVIPAGFIVFVPAQYLFLGFNIWWLLGTIGVTILITILAFLLFKLGLRRYNSGNLMGGRL